MGVRALHGVGLNPNLRRWVLVPAGEPLAILLRGCSTVLLSVMGWVGRHAHCGGAHKLRRFDPLPPVFAGGREYAG